jgi:signal transduction histidine kinase
MPIIRAPSLRVRLMLIAAATICVTVSLVGISLWYSFTSYIERRVQQELDQEWYELAGVFELDEAGQPVLSRSLSDSRYGQPYSGAYWRISAANGEPLLRSRSLWDGDLKAQDGGPLRPHATTSEARGPAGEVVDVISRRVTFDALTKPRSFELAVAFDNRDIAALRASFARDVAMPLAAVALVLIVGAYLQMTLGLRPLRRLQAQLTAIHTGRAAQIEGHFPSEVAPVVRDLNDLLRRQDDLLRRARERAGDLAHGLKTPLTILTGEARRMERQGNASDALALREQIALMLSHIERELARARSHGEAVAVGTLTDARSTTERLLGLVRRMPRGDAIRWDNAVPADLRLRMAADDFGEVLGNLLDNARKFADRLVRVSAQLGETGVVVHVDDDGPGISEDQRSLVVERGTTSGGGTGLGLAIVRDVLAGYGSALALAHSPAGGCRASFTVPGTVVRAAPRSGRTAASPVGKSPAQV